MTTTQTWFVFVITIFREIIMFLAHDVVLIYFRETNSYFLNSRIFIEEKCIDWCFFKSALKIFSQVKDFVYITQFSKSAMASSPARLEFKIEPI